MRTIFYTELLKLKRTNLFQVGMTIVALSCIFSIIPIFAADDTIKDYALIMCNILENNCMYFSTVLITLMGSYMMSREYTDDTLKNLLLIPMTFQNILSGKLLTLLFMTVICGLANAALGTIAGMLFHLPGINSISMLTWTLRILAGNFLIYISVLPIIMITSCIEGTGITGIAVSFIYGFLSTIDWKPMNFYPVKAVLILLDPTLNSKYDWLNYSKGTAGVVLITVFMFSLLLLIKARLIPIQYKKSKTPRKKGW